MKKVFLFILYIILGGLALLGMAGYFLIAMGLVTV